MNHQFKDDMLPRKHFLSLQLDLKKFAPATDEEKRHCRFTAAAFAVGSAFGVAAEWLAGDSCAAAMLYALCFMLAYTAFVFSFPEKGKPHEGT